MVLYLAFYHLFPVNKHPKSFETTKTDIEIRDKLDELFHEFDIKPKSINLKLKTISDLKTMGAEYCAYLAFGPRAINDSLNAESIHQIETQSQQQTFSQTPDILRCVVLGNYV